MPLIHRDQIQKSPIPSSGLSAPYNNAKQLILKQNTERQNIKVPSSAIEKPSGLHNRDFSQQQKQTSSSQRGREGSMILSSKTIVEQQKGVVKDQQSEENIEAVKSPVRQNQTDNPGTNKILIQDNNNNPEKPPTKLKPQYTEISLSSEEEDFPKGAMDDDNLGDKDSGSSSSDDEDDEEGQDGEYFESSSNSSGYSGLQINDNQFKKELFSMDKDKDRESQEGSGIINKMRQHLLQQRHTAGVEKIDKVIFQQMNSEELHRTELGGVVVYDSYARMIGNQHMIKYYEQNPPKKVDFYKLFSKAEVARADKLFYKEPRERDFQNEFDKFLFKHLPKFAPQREYNHHGPAVSNAIGGLPQHSFTVNVPQQENLLIFESRFECGNLRRAIKVNNIEYNLWLENDVNTKGHTQWFYFKVIHRYPKKQKIQFNILNLAKPQSLYQLGMKPCIYSKYYNKQDGKEWFRGGQDIKYFQNEIPRKTPNPQNNNNNQFLYNNNGAGEGLEYYFTLSFSYEFEEQEDEVWFAQAVPYTFTDLQDNIIKMQEQTEKLNIMKSNILCKELTGSPCPLLTITENLDTYLDYYDQFQLNKELPNIVRKQFHKKYMKSKKLFKQSQESKGKVRRLLRAAFEEEMNSFYENNSDLFKNIDDTHNTTGDGAIFGRRYDNFHTKLKQYIIDHFHKKTIFITSRVHPGEPQSSHMMLGVLEYLISDEASELRKNFVFRIVPMLNVDGVVYGNQRCSLLGVDLNRRWVQPNVFLHPTIFYAKQLIRFMHNERRVLMYCDLHGHSRKQNAFFYACAYKNYEHEGRIKNAQLRLMPLLCCRKGPDLYNFKDCRFRIEKCKESTARVVIFREFNIMNSFTLEASFFGKEPEIPDPIEVEEESQIDDPVQNRVSRQNLMIQQMLQKPPQGTHFKVEDLKKIGQILPQVIHNYLPREQSKLEMLSAKILEIFYQEFIKLIPPYMLKKEEEKKRHLVGLESQDTNQNQIQAGMQNQNQITQMYPMPNLLFTKSPTMVGNRPPISTSPRLSNSNNIQPINYQKVQTMRKQQLGKQSIFVENSSLFNNKKVLKIQNLQSNQASTPSQQLQSQGLTTLKKSNNPLTNPNTVSRKQKKGGLLTSSKRDIDKSSSDMNQGQNNGGGGAGTGTETDTFSQIINIHQNHEEVLDFELFIKGENHKLQLYEQKLRENTGNKPEMEDDDENGGQSDSSADSDESAKNLLIQQSLQQHQNLAKQLTKIKKSIGKKSLPPTVKKNNEDDPFRSIDGVKSQVAKNKRQTPISIISQKTGSDSLKLRQPPKNNPVESRQNLRLVNKTQSKKSRETQELQYDKIPHTQSKSPKSKTIDDIANQGVQEEESKNEEDILQSLEKDINACETITPDKSITEVQNHKNTGNILFQSYENVKQGGGLRHIEKSRPQQYIMPLYENPAYHQTRLGSLNTSQDRQRHYFNNAQNQSLIPQSNTNASILYNNVKAVTNPFSFRNAQQRPLYEPYFDEAKLNKSTLQSQVPGASQLTGSIVAGTYRNNKQQALVNLMRPSTQQEVQKQDAQSTSLNANNFSFSNKVVPPTATVQTRSQKAQLIQSAIQNNNTTTPNTINNSALLQPFIQQDISDVMRKVNNYSSDLRVIDQDFNLDQPMEDNYLTTTTVNKKAQSEQKPNRNSIQRVKRQNSRQQKEIVITSQADNGSVQRISFKELLESSRQQRTGVNEKQIMKTAIKCYNPKIYQGHIPTQTNSLAQMFKQSYQRIQQKNGVENNQVNQRNVIGLPDNFDVSIMSMDDAENDISNFKRKGLRVSQDGSIACEKRQPQAYTDANNSLQTTQRDQHQQLRVHLVDHSTTPNIVIINKNDVITDKLSGVRGALMYQGLLNPNQNQSLSQHHSNQNKNNSLLQTTSQNFIKTKTKGLQNLNSGDITHEGSKGIEDFLTKKTVNTPQKKIKMINFMGQGSQTQKERQDQQQRGSSQLNDMGSLNQSQLAQANQCNTNNGIVFFKQRSQTTGGPGNIVNLPISSTQLTQPQPLPATVTLHATPPPSTLQQQQQPHLKQQFHQSSVLKAHGGGGGFNLRINNNNAAGALGLMIGMTATLNENTTNHNNQSSVPTSQKKGQPSKIVAMKKHMPQQTHSSQH